MRVVVVGGPVSALHLDEVKQHLTVEHDEDDALIAGMAEAATAHIDGPDGWLGRAIGEQSLEAYLEAPTFDRVICLPYPPVIAVTSIEARRADGWELIPADHYEVRGAEVWRAGSIAWPRWVDDPEAVRVRYTAGYSALPAPIRAALLLMVGDLYQNRETVTEGAVAQIPMSTTVARLLAPYRVWR